MSTALERDEILGLDAYERARQAIRQRAIAARGRRRVVLGPSASLVFENRETLRYQVQEMLRAERIVDDTAIEHELETYSALLPTESELSATLFLEFPDPTTRADRLRELVGVEEHLALVIGERRIAATFDAAQLDDDRVSAVQFVRFPLGEGERAALRRGAPVRVELDHPRYRHAARLPGATIEALIADLDDARAPH